MTADAILLTSPSEGEVRGVPKITVGLISQRFWGRPTVPVMAAPHSIRSREISWASAFEVLQPVIDRAGRRGVLPEVGSHDWIDLADSDPRKVGAIYRAALLWALHSENRGVAHVEASHAVSAANDWSQTAKENRQRAEFLRENPWAKRISA